MADIKKILSQMTLDEKIGQLMQLEGNLLIDTDADVTGPMNELGITDDNLKAVGSILNITNAKEAIEVQKKHLEADRNKIPLLIMMDVIHGYRTIYPIPLALGCSFDDELVMDCTRVAAQEASAAGVHVTFNPMVDYVRDARWGRVMETCGEDVLLNSVMGAAQVKAFQGNNLKDSDSLAACVKHFAAYGGAEAGRDYNTVELSEHALREYYLPAYKACIEAGATMIMPSFNTMNGVPSIANPWLMKKILKEEWGFEGVVISDYNAVGELLIHGIAENIKKAARLAFENYCDIEMCSSAYCHYLKGLVEDGVFTVEQIDEAVLRVLELKDRLGLFESPFKGASEEKENERYLSDKNREVVRRAAEESAVLLKNNGVLPLSDNVKKIALIGPFADNHEILGSWSCRGRCEESVTVKEGISALLPEAEITVVGACSNIWGDTDRSGFDEAVKAAKSADVAVVCIGEPHTYSGEGNSRSDLTIPGVQEELALAVAEANKNTAVLTFSGRPLVINSLEKNIPAILHMWFPGTEGGAAAANLLFGKANPCGKLSMSFPKSVGQCPIYYDHPNTGRPKTFAEDEYQAYSSSYIDCGNLPLYSFGHGLSYSDFIYENMEISSNEIAADEKLTVRITVYNDSNFSGKETVMLYMRDMYASNARPVQKLIAFEKVHIEAYERKTVEFCVTEEMLRFWNNENKFVSEAGEFSLSTGYADHLIHTKYFMLK